MNNAGKYLVSVVIPSIGRPQLAGAVRSAKTQTVAEHIEVIVVFDLAEADLSNAVKSSASEADRVLFTGGKKGAPNARNLGVDAAQGTWIAFLDDDDTWDPLKIELQLSVGQSLLNTGASPVIGCRSELVSSDRPERRIPSVPARLIRPNEGVSNYLFAARRPGSRRASFFTSSIFAEKALCERVRWDETLPRHQDWDWLLRAEEIGGASFAQLPQQLVSYSLGSANSISATSDWSSSIDWANSNRHKFSSRAHVDFLCAQPLRYSLQARDVKGVQSVLKGILVTRRLPSLGPLLIGASGVLPRRRLQRLMSLVR